MANPITTAAYAASQGARVAWYSAHYLMARRLAGPVHRPDEPRFEPQSPPGSPSAVRAAFLDLFAQDHANIEAGLYPAPAVGNLASALANSARFFRDLPRVDARRLARGGVEVREGAAPGRYPAYYLQNFHYQTDGWLSRDSAAIYDTQVEVLFAGAGEAMRRVGLGLLAGALKGRDPRGVRLLDVACGNGRFLSQVLEAFPRMPVTGLDLSPAYAEAARQRLEPWPQAEIVAGQAEASPFEDEAFDAATCIYLFHELPPKVRREAAGEIARVVKPGGLFLFADSAQTGDAPALDRMIEYFPVSFHEPFYRSYQKEDLPALFDAAGFTLEASRVAFLTKCLLFRKR